MALLQFASTLEESRVPVRQPGAEGDGKGDEKKSAGKVDISRYYPMMGGVGSSADAGGPARLGYGGEEGQQAWKEEQKRKEKEKEKRAKKRRKDKQEKTRNKIAKLINDKNMSFEEASSLVYDIAGSDSEEKKSDSSSD